MKTLRERLALLAENTTSFEVKSLCNTILDYGKALSEKSLFDLTVEKLSEVSEKKDVSDFLKKEKRFYWIEWGLSESLIDGLLESDTIKLQPALKNRLSSVREYLENRKINNVVAIAEAENVINSLGWAKEVSLLKETLEAEIVDFKHEIRILHNARQLANTQLNTLLFKVVESLEQFIYEGSSKLAAKSIMESIKQYTSTPQVKEIYESLEEIATKDSKFRLKNVIPGKFDITDVYRPVHVNESKETVFCLEGRFFAYDGANVRAVKDISGLPKSFVELSTMYDENKAITVSENELQYDVSNYVVKMVETGNGVHSFVNETEVLGNNFDSYFGYVARNDSYTLSHVPTMRRLLESMNSLVHIDFAKVIKSKQYPDVSAVVFKTPNGLSLFKRNDSMNEAILYKNLNAMQLKKAVDSFIGFDLTESLMEFLPEIEGEMTKIEKEQKEILESIDLLNKKLEEIEHSKNDPLVYSSITLLEQLGDTLSTEIYNLKMRYNHLNDKKKQLGDLSEQHQMGFEDDIADKMYGATSQKKTNPSYDYGKSTQYSNANISDDDGLDWITNPIEKEGSETLYPGQTVIIKSKNIKGKLVNIDYANDFAIVHAPGQIKMIKCRIHHISKCH